MEKLLAHGKYIAPAWIVGTIHVHMYIGVAGNTKLGKQKSMKKINRIVTTAGS